MYCRNVDRIAKFALHKLSRKPFVRAVLKQQIQVQIQ